MTSDKMDQYSRCNNKMDQYSCCNNVVADSIPSSMKKKELENKCIEVLGGK